MLFTSPSFLYVFLPLFLLLYFAAPDRSKNAVLMGGSFLFYSVLAGAFTIVLLLSVLANFRIALWMERARTRSGGRAWLIAAVCLNLLPLLYYKYAGFSVEIMRQLAALAGAPAPLPGFVAPALPAGISFFTHQALSYVADVHWRRVRPLRSVVDFGMYHACFPQLIAGPIVRFEEIEEEVLRRRHRREDVYDGIVQFCFGLAKKVILADTIAVLANSAFDLPAGELTFGSAWLGILAYTLQLYFDFSGYSDMAIGLGRILGFHYPENFDQPYRSRSVTEFWRRWHMTLSRWFRDYVYIPLGGNRATLPRNLFNLFTVFFLCGLWHGAAYSFVLWGLYHGVLLVTERLLRFAGAPSLPRPLGWAYTMTAVMVGWVFFRAGTIEGALQYVHTMFTPGRVSLAPAMGALFNDDKLFYLAAGLVVSLLPYERLLQFRERQYRFGAVAGGAALMLLAASMVMLSVNSFTPFIYFRF